MKKFERGVSYYTFANLEIAFPENDICCFRCPLMGVEIKSDREYCRKTGEYLVAPRDVIGFSCPLRFEEKEN